MRKSHVNPAITQIYKEFLGTPLGKQSHHLLHTHYQPRGQAPEPAKPKKQKASRKKPQA
jgi:NADH-quinone oxidoreductase subunit G/NADP-reducing hydrogenase subunit HndD